ncbi:AAA family ATPase [Deinococcus detaillensis]|uniref:AAA family ATPase n=1 Tax=Deinococcus detaillensis TaxID=2592048 RepID=A0A553UFT6_9DEIO|nr:AAA family ATPase [Deinococcus detaillensis]TSA79052.1 AAA family ATPase [Deinococcus detaillensis]
MPPSDLLEFKLLGVPALNLGRLELTPSVRKGLGLLAYLALEGPTDRHKLADLLWTNLTESDARRNLRQELWRLQRSPLSAWLDVKTERVGLTTNVWIDVNDFHQALATHDLGRALAGYGGPLLSRFELPGAGGFEDWLAERRDGLTALWKDAAQRHAAELERAGDLRGALGLQVQLLQDDEFQEVHQREAIRLQLALGERAAALSRYEHYAQMLRGELGLEPLPETRALIANLNAAAPPEPAAPALNPGQRLELPLVGRRAEWAMLQEAPAALTVVVGEAGIGKTRLAGAFASTFGAALHLRAFEVSLHTPLYPAAEALRTALTDARSRERLTALDGLWRTEAARLVPELDPAASSAFQPDGRARFLDGVARALICAAGVDGVLVFDDLHWADPMTLELLLHLVRQPPEQRPRLIATARAQELADHPALSAALGSLEREGHLCRLPLTGLSGPDVLNLVQVLSGSSSAQLFSARLFEATSGHPLYLLESLRHLFDTGLLQQAPDGSWSTPFDGVTRDYAELPLPHSVREATVQRVSHHGPAARRLLEAASLSEDGFGLDDLAPALSLSDWEALEALERLLGAGFLQRTPTGYGFSHDLVRRVLQEEQTPERRRLIHRKLAERLEQTGGPASRVARHLEEAGQRAQAAGWRVRSAQDAAQLYAHRVALGQYQMALDNGLTAREAYDVRLARAELFRALGELPAREAELTALQSLAEHLSDSDLQAELSLRWIIFFLDAGYYAQAHTASQALLSQHLLLEQQAAALRLAGFTLGRLGRHREGEDLLTQALALPGERSALLLAQLHNDLSNLTLERGDLPLARQHNEAALNGFRADSNARAVAIALNSSARIAHSSGDEGLALRRLEEALSAARTTGDLHLQVMFLNNMVRLQVDHGHLEQALIALNEGLAVLPQPRDPVHEGLLRSRAADVYRLKGELGQALEHDLLAIELADQIGAVAVQLTRRIHLARFLLQLGDPEGTERWLGQARDFHGSGQEPHLLLEIAHAELGLYRRQGSAVLGRLENLLAQQGNSQGDDWSWLTLLRSAAYLALGRPDAALEALPVPLQRPSLQALELGIRLHAEANPHAQTEARALLASSRLAPLEALALTRSLLAASAPAEQRSLEKDHQRLHLQLAASLPADLRPHFAEMSLLSKPSC